MYVDTYLHLWKSIKALKVLTHIYSNCSKYTLKYTLISYSKEHENNSRIQYLLQVTNTNFSFSSI